MGVSEEIKLSLNRKLVEAVRQWMYETLSKNCFNGTDEEVAEEIEARIGDSLGLDPTKY